MPDHSNQRPQPEPIVNAVIYCRVSTRYQEPNGSLQDQEAHGQTYCERHGVNILRVVHEVYDNDDMESRPLLNEITEMAERGEFDLLIADKVDRFSRADPRETDFYIMTLERLGVKTVILDADQTGDPDIDDILFFFKKWKAKREKRDTTERTQRGRMRRLTGQGRKRGVMVGPHPLYGYVWDDPQKLHRYALVRDSDSAKWVIWIFERAADGWDSARIADELNTLGVPTIRRYYQSIGLASPLLKTSDLWRPRVVREIVRNDDYLGQRVAFKTQWMRHSDRKTRDRLTGKLKPAKYCLPRDEHDPKRLAQEGLCEPLVSAELAAKARAYLKQYQEAHSYRRTNPTTADGAPLPDRLLAGGFLLCGHCGATMIGVSSGARKWFERRYICRRHRVFINGETATDCPGGSVSVTGDAFEEVIWWMVVKLLTDGKTLPDAVAELRAKADTRIEARTQKRETLREAIARSEETIAVNNRLMQATARQDERFTETRQFAMWRLDVQQAEDAIAGYETDIAKLDDEDEPMERHLQVLDRLASRQHNEAVVTLFTLDIEGKRQILREMNLRVVVWNKAHKPRWGIRIGPPDSPFVVTAQLAPTAALTKEGPATPLMSDGIELQHYIWHEIAGRVAQLLVVYGAEDERGADQDS
jgi:DNA invertase Pin-like site-specific DNA recombinase